MRQLTLDMRLPVAVRLDTFVAGQNAQLVDALQRLAQYSEPRSLFIWGPHMSGRSHLLQATVGAAQTAGRMARYCAAGSMLHADHDFDKRLDLIAIDDIHLASFAEQAEVFRYFVGDDYQHCAILLAADAPPQELNLREDLRTRIGQALVFEVKELSDTDKASTLRSHARSRGIPLDESTIDYLLRHGRRELPWLLAALDALDEASLAGKRAITIPLIKEVLGQ